VEPIPNLFTSNPIINYIAIQYSHALQGSIVSFFGNNIIPFFVAILRLAWILFLHFFMTNWLPANYNAVKFLAAQYVGINYIYKTNKKTTTDMFEKPTLPIIQHVGIS